jgi:hypothetical protein
MSIVVPIWFRSPQAMISWLGHLTLGSLAVHTGMILDEQPVRHETLQAPSRGR